MCNAISILKYHWNVFNVYLIFFQPLEKLPKIVQVVRNKVI